MSYALSSFSLYFNPSFRYLLAIQPLVVYKGRMPKVMINARIEKGIVDAFDRVAAMHQRDRTKELKALMLEDIRREIPDYKEPSPE